MSSPPTNASLRLRAASELAPRPYTWLWQHRLALGELALFEGDPGLGKSLAALDLCARLSTGRPMPDGSPGCGPANAIVLYDEDPQQAVLERLQSLGADPSRVFLADRDDEAAVSLPDDIEGLAGFVQQTEVRLVVLDPVVSFLGPGVHENSNQSIRRALQPLRQLARQHAFALLLVRNLNKNGGQQALYRGSGTLGFLAAARAGWLFGRDPRQHGRMVMAEQKNNLSPPQPSLAYTITSQGEGPPRLSWDGPCSAAARDLLARNTRGPAPQMRDRACEFLAEVLKQGPCTPRAIWEAAAGQGLSQRTLQRAREELGIKIERRMEGNRPVYYWLLPKQELPTGTTGEDDSTDLSPWLKPLEERYPRPTPLDER